VIKKTNLLDKNRRLFSDMSKEAVFVHTTSGEKHEKNFNQSEINVTLHQNQLNNRSYETVFYLRNNVWFDGPDDRMLQR
jgi:hypothetical protein